MFETFDIPSLLLLPQDLLAVLSAGKSTAVVVDAGLGATTVSVLYNMTRPAGRSIAVTMVTRGVTMVTRGGGKGLLLHGNKGVSAGFKISDGECRAVLGGSTGP